MRFHTSVQAFSDHSAPTIVQVLLFQLSSRQSSLSGILALATTDQILHARSSSNGDGAVIGHGLPG